jgi:hypothetical protein
VKAEEEEEEEELGPSGSMKEATAKVGWYLI